MNYSLILIITLFILCLTTASVYSQDTWEELQEEIHTQFDSAYMQEWRNAFDTVAFNSPIIFEGIALPCKRDTLINGDVIDFCEFKPSHIYRGDKIIDDRSIIYYVNHGPPENFMYMSDYFQGKIHGLGIYKPMILFFKEIDSTEISSEVFDDNNNIYISYSDDYYGGYGMVYSQDLEGIDYDFGSGMFYPLFQTIIDFENYIKNWKGVTLPKRKLFYSRKSRLRKLERFMKKYDEHFSFYLD